MCVYLDSQVIQVVSQYVSSSCDGSFSLVVLSGAQPWFNVLHGTIASHIVSDNAKLQTGELLLDVWQVTEAI